MTLPRETYTNEIRDRLEKISGEIKSRYNGGDSTIAWLAELHIQELLNIIFEDEYKFFNLNYKRKNYPSVDLADVDKGIAWQITVTNNREGIKAKIRHTIESFYKNFDNERYIELSKIKKIKIFIATGIESTLSPRDIPGCIETKNGVVTISDELMNQNDIWDFRRLIDEICKVTDISRLDKIHKAVIGVVKRPKRVVFEYDRSYIKRTISSSENSKVQFHKDLFNRERKHILLLANAAEGKSTYVDIVCSELSKDGNVFCIKVPLIGYASNLENSIEAVCQYWRNYFKQQQLIILFDGLDEVKGDLVDIVFKEIEEFIALHPNTYVITTCRMNYSPIGDQSSQVFKAVPFFLDPITYKESIVFSKKTLGDNLDKFEYEIKAYDYSKLITNPFFLNELIGFYQNEGALPQTKSALMAGIVQRRFEFEEVKVGEVKSFVSRNRYEILKNLRLLSLTMQLSGENKVTEIELQQTIQDSSMCTMVNRLFLKPIKNDRKEWRFEHNNFMEYFAAQCLVNLEWSSIKKLIEVPGTNKLKPRWLNTLSFYIDIANDEADEDVYRKVIDWLAEYNQESFVKFEADKVPFIQRSEIVKGIFKEKNKDQARVWGEGYDVTDLAKFSDIENNDRLVLDLLEKLKQKFYCDSITRDIIDFINHRVNILSVKSAITKVYLEIYPSYYKLSIGSSIIDGLDQWRIYDKSVVEALIKDGSILEDVDSLFTAFNYLSDSGYPINAILLQKAFLASYNSKKQSHTYPSFSGLVRLIQSGDVLLSFITFISNLNDHHYWDNDVFLTDLFKAINNKSIELLGGRFEDYKTYCTSVNRLAKLGYSPERTKTIPYLIPFLANCPKKDIIFKQYFLHDAIKNKGFVGLFCMAALLYSPDMNEYIFNCIDSGKITDDRVHSFINALALYNRGLLDCFELALAERYTERFMQEPNPWEVNRKDTNAILLEALLDKTKFIEVIQVGLKAFKNVINYDDLTHHKYYHVDNINTPEINITLKLLRWLIGNGKHKTHNEILEWFNNDEAWEWFVLNQHLRSTNKNILPERNKQWCRNWCLKVERDIDFEDAIKYNAIEGKYNVNNLFNAYISIALTVNVKPIRENAIKLVKYGGFFDDGSYINGERKVNYDGWIISTIGREGLNREFCSILKRGNIEGSLLLQGIARYLENYSLKECTEYLPKYIINPDIQYYIRNRFFDIFISLDGMFTDALIAYLDLIENNEQVNWSILKYLYANAPEACSVWIKKNYKGKELSVEASCVLLVDQHTEDAMKMYLNELKERKQQLSDMFYDHGNFLELLSKKNVEHIKLKQFYFVVLASYADKDFNYVERGNALTYVFNGLQKLIGEITDGQSVFNETEAFVDTLCQAPYHPEFKDQIYYSNMKFKTEVIAALDKGTRYRKALREAEKVISE
ncbi:SMEK domain-containing protein [Saccharicrinis aurantiacus]|uniref:SMEK domain-containing protein n=1 Tax=Saccharicrinis aurantiacus TaxID=1849719 RepID=UPI00094FA1C1|nr:SMEK domain-containing protein [Saccharicrinis aurantiacus]